MEKISITIDLTKIDKSKIQTRTYENSQGEVVTKKELKLDVVPVKEPKVVAEGGTWLMKKTHFVAMTQTKEEREAKADTVFVGDGVQFENKGETVQVAADDPSDIPF